MPPEKAGDETLLRRYLDGDQSAFTSLMRRHEDRIYGLAYRMTGDRADALEATQETFISAFKRAGSFRGDAAFSTWLYRIGVNACRDLLRKKGRLPAPQEEVPEPRSSGRQATLEDTVALRMDLARALAALAEDYREAVVMHDLGGIPYEEIASLTGVALGTVKSRISRGRQQLARLMEQPAGAETSKDKR